MCEEVAQLPSDARDVPFLTTPHYYLARCAEPLFCERLRFRPKQELQRIMAGLTRLALFWIPQPMQALRAPMHLKASRSLSEEVEKRFSTSVLKGP